ncbi:MAG: hypothetical protein J6W13_09025 [Salinivirgaceae bacterium]|nr:hypothetical protein [Salinivirgaceae bacterium]
MEYTYNQKMAIVRLLLDIISVDGKIDARETFYFEKVKEELGLSPDDHFKVNNFSTLISLSIVKAMTDEQKADYAELMRRMILADNVIEENERIAYEDICEFCKVKTCQL